MQTVQRNEFHLADTQPPKANDGGDITGLLRSWRRGDSAALGTVTALIYADLRRLAASRLQGERADHTLGPTALAHEAFLRLLQQRRVDWRSRTHFFALASTMMRRILVDYARSRVVARGGRGGQPLGPGELELALERAPELIALDDALVELAKVSPEQSRLVELRYFAGLSVEETAEILGVTGRTVKRRWRTAKLWLYRFLSEDSGDGQ